MARIDYEKWLGEIKEAVGSGIEDNIKLAINHIWFDGYNTAFREHDPIREARLAQIDLESRKLRWTSQ